MGNIRWGVLQYCNAGRVIGAEKIGNTCYFPENAEKPADKRLKDCDDTDAKRKKEAVE